MLSRAFLGRKANNRIKRNPSEGENSNRSSSLHYNHEDEECIVGLTGELPLNMCNIDGGGSYTKAKSKGVLVLREVMMGSVQMLGESGIGISEKVVLLDGMVYASKRFKKLTVSKKEFGRRIERMASVSKGCEYLLQVRAYLYAKRIKIILCDYYPMGSLADLLNGARELGHTPLDWNQRLTIVFQVAKAISYIHGLSPIHEKNFQLNVHGNIKASNVLIQTNFSACLSEYGFIQLTGPVETASIWQCKVPETFNSTEKMSQKSDICSFGLMVLDMLGGPDAPCQVHCIQDRKEEIKEGVAPFFEFLVEGKARKQALLVLDIALSCTNRSPEARPSIDQILVNLDDVLI
ncbi:Leucine-rich repeat receptor-like protein kinase pxc1 [Thalictrum thalictroides]|uniref:Leucine-rich repeat receptor-like protein kinase pxc1 n=1 Tax=Thalictrum thalictroides TaxID=46969 RepID=A0A7J6W782_THATH|nr:Leucine-rich repeat receptor-like protein kinase pxc1 [Thalictrum thalictroides]